MKKILFLILMISASLLKCAAPATDKRLETLFDNAQFNKDSHLNQLGVKLIDSDVKERIYQIEVEKNTKQDAPIYAILNGIFGKRALNAYGLSTVFIFAIKSLQNFGDQSDLFRHDTLLKALQAELGNPAQITTDKVKAAINKIYDIGTEANLILNKSDFSVLEYQELNITNPKFPIDLVKQIDEELSVNKDFSHIFILKNRHNDWIPIVMQRQKNEPINFLILDPQNANRLKDEDVRELIRIFANTQGTIKRFAQPRVKPPLPATPQKPQPKPLPARPQPQKPAPRPLPQAPKTLTLKEEFEQAGLGYEFSPAALEALARPESFEKWHNINEPISPLYGYTALFLATGANKPNLIKRLLKIGANPLKGTEGIEKGVLPIHVAEKKYVTEADGSWKETYDILKKATEDKRKK